MIRQDDYIAKLKDKVLHMEAKQTKSEILIFGLKECEGLSCKDIAKQFFRDVMEITIEIDIVHAYWKVQSQNKPMVVRFSNPVTKGLIYSKVSNLKGKKNSTNKGYRIVDHLPEELAEPLAWQRQIITENRKLSTAQQQAMSFKKGQLHINNEPYKKKVLPPRAKSLLKMSESDLADLKEISVSGGYTETEGGSRFIAYATKVTSLQDVWKNYLHMKRLHADANHVTMAYRLPSLEKAHDEDYLDDREINAGRRLLQTLIELGHESIAVFIVRYYGGKLQSSL